MNIQSISTSLPLPSSPEAGAVARDVKAFVPPVLEQQAQLISEAQLQAATQNVKDYIKPFNSSLEFSVDKDTDKFITKVIDSTTKEVIRQIPSEEMLTIAKTLDSIKGLFVKQSA